MTLMSMTMADDVHDDYDDNDNNVFSPFHFFVFCKVTDSTFTTPAVQYVPGVMIKTVMIILVFLLQLHKE